MTRPKIRLGPAGSGGYSKGTLEGVQKLPGLGLQALEVEFVRGVGMGIPLARQVGTEAKKQGISLSVHAPYYINLASKEKVKIQQSKKRILDSCERMHHMGGGPVVFHPAFFGLAASSARDVRCNSCAGAQDGMDKEKVYQAAKQAIEDMQAAIRDNGWNCRLAPETTGKHSALGSLDETVRLVKETGCFCCIDFAHLYARQYGKIDYGEMLDNLKPIMPKLDNHLHIHFSGIEYTQKGEKNHITIDHDMPPFRPLAKEILDRKLDVTIISESPVTWKDSLKMRKVFEGMGYGFS